MSLIHKAAQALARPAGVQVSASSASVFGSKVGTAYAGVQFNSDGVEYKTPVDGDIGYSISLGAWLDRGLNSQAWVQWHRTGGTLGDWNSADDGDSRLVLSTSRAWRIVRNGPGVNTIIGYFEFWDAATDGNLLQTTGSRTFTADWIV